MTVAWTINVSGRVYGPFTSERMRGFVNEGRLAPHSLVAREGSEDWREAREEPEFTDVFAQRNTQNTGAPAPRAMAPAPQPQAQPQPLQPQPQAQPQPAPQASSAPMLRTVQPAHAPQPTADVPDHARAHFAVILDKSQASSRVEDAINSLGPAYQLADNVWIISTEQSVSAVRNRLVQELGKSDALFVIDASRGKAAWFNFGPEADVRIRRVWQKTA